MLRIALVVLCFWAAGCSCGGGGVIRRVDGGGSDANARDAFVVRSDANFPDANAMPEICNGLDDDANGIIDDVDRGGDGVCDCLPIATLGVAGTAGTSGVFEAWLDARSDVDAVDLGDQVLTPELLAPYQVILSQDISGRPRTAAEAAALEQWIRAGGGFMTLTGYGGADEPTNVNALLAPTGIQYAPGLVLCGCGFTLPVDGWHTHPLSDMVTRLGMDNGYPVIGAGTVVADQDGHELLRAMELGSGHVIVWADEWISFDSEWTGHPDYQVERFWLNALKWMSPANECQVPILI